VVQAHQVKAIQAVTAVLNLLFGEAVEAVVLEPQDKVAHQL
jgi:hypothetical protein